MKLCEKQFHLMVQLMVQMVQKLLKFAIIVHEEKLAKMEIVFAKEKLATENAFLQIIAAHQQNAMKDNA